MLNQQNVFKQHTRSLLAVAVALAMNTAFTLPVQAQIRYVLDQPQQSLADAIREVGKKTGVNILFDPALVAGKTAQPLSGQLTVEEALSRLLADSGLVVQRSDANTLTIQRPVSSSAVETTVAGGGAQVQEEIVVSASRIQRTGFTAPTPTTFLGSEEIQARAAVTMSSVLFDLPAMRPTTTAVALPGNAGGNFANLRGLGQNRTLVLVDGHRFVATTTGGSVDTNVVPTSLVERVEVVTGGASAAWGSDAVAGVTNFIFKKYISGFQGSVQYGQSSRGDTKQKNLNLAWGTDYADGRGQFMIAAEYSKLYDIAKNGDRDWGRQAYGIVNDTVNGVPVRRWVPGTVAVTASYGGVIVASTNGGALPANSPFRVANGGNGIQFGPNGSVVPFVYGTNISPNLMVGGTGTDFSPQLVLSAPLDRKNVYARTTFDFTDNLRGFAEASYAESSSDAQTQIAVFPNANPAITIQRDNAFLPASVRTIMTNANLNSFFLGRAFNEFGTYTRGGAENEVSRVAAGLNGDFDAVGKNWKWSVYATSGETKYEEYISNNFNEANFRAALDTVIGPGGVPICRINSTAPADIAIVSAANYQGRGAAAGCVAANPFGDGSLTPAVAAYVLGRSYAAAVIRQDVGSATLQGEPFSTWAGPVSVVGGLEYRRESTNQTVDDIAQRVTPAFQTGGWQFGNRPKINGSVTVKEYFAETVIPLLKNMPLARSLDLNAAARNTDYSTSGQVTTWKVGLTYSPVAGVLFRATKSKDIRAPNSSELFQSLAAATVANITDYGRPGNPSYPVSSSSAGNPDLKPEEADTRTFGITWEPSQIPGFNASVDVYKIFLKDNIATATSANVVASCYGAAGFPVTPANCALFTRDTSGNINNVTSVFTNQAFQRNSGMDIEFGYRTPLSRFFNNVPGNLSLRVLGTYLDEQTTNNFLTSIDNAGTTGLPHWRWTASGTYSNGPLSLFLQGRFTEDTVLSATPLATDLDINKIPSRFYLNGSVQYTLFDDASRGRLVVYGNINNILDRDPPLNPGATYAPNQVSFAPDYDKVGRAFTVGLRFSY